MTLFQALFLTSIARVVCDTRCMEKLFDFFTVLFGICRWGRHQQLLPYKPEFSYRQAFVENFLTLPSLNIWNFIF